MNRNSFLRTWMVFAILGLALIIAVAGIIYGWQSNRDARLASQDLATAQAAEQGMNSQVAYAESTAQAALRQKVNAEWSAQEAINAQATAESDAQEAINAQATAESAAQQRALVEALSNQEVQAAQEKAKLATSRWLAAQSLNTLEQDPQLSAHLALQAMESGQTFEAESALHQVLPNLRMLKPTPFKDILSYAENWDDVIWALTRDSKFLIKETDEGIKVIDLATGTESILAQAKSCRDISSTQDGRWVVAWCTNRWEVWDIKTATLKATRPEYRIYHTDYNGYSLGQYDIISPSSTRPLMIYIWDPEQIRVEEAVSGVERYVFLPAEGTTWRTSVASPDGRLVAAIDNHGQMVMWEMDSGAEILRYKSGSYFYILFSSDGTHFLYSGASVRIWDVSLPSQEPTLLQELMLATRSSGAVFNKDSSRLAVSFYDGTVQVWDIKPGRLLLTLYAGSELSGSMAFSPYGNRLYSASWDGTAMEWDISGVMNGLIGRAPYSPDGKQLALASEGGYASIVNSLTGEVQLSWQANSGWSVGNMDLNWSPDGEYLATFSWPDNGIKIWEAATGSLLRALPKEGYIIQTIAWSPDSRRIATIDDYTLLVWDVASGERLLTVEDQLWWSFPELVFSPDGTKIAAGHAYCSYSPDDCYYELVIWDSTTGAELLRLGSDSGQASSSGGGRKFLARIANINSYYWVSPSWRINNSHWFRPSFGYISSVFFALAFSPDGNYLAAGTPDGIILWKFTQAGVEQDQVLGVPSGENGYFSLAFSPDGTLLSSSSLGGNTRVWDLETGQVRWEVAGGGKVAFSPDGTRLATSSYGITTLHVLPLDELIEQARSRIIRPMTPEECRAYLHEESCPAWP